MVGRRRALGIMVTALALVFGTGVPAFASHFRASNDTVTYANGTLHWTVNQAWRKGVPDNLITSAGAITVSQNGTTTPGVPSSNLVNTSDLTNPLYDTTVQSADIDISGILASAGTYKVYATNCCRVAGVANTSGGGDNFSQAFTFTINSDQSVNLPPRPNVPTLYQIIKPTPGVPFTVDYTATDPESAAVTYSLVTATGAPDYGATALPCSTFIGGVLTVDASLCTGGDVFSTAYAAGTFYAVKARATDPAGDYSEVDTLLRVPTIPAPSLGAPTLSRGTATFVVTLTDNYADSYVVTCTNTADASDVVTATSPTQPITVSGLSPSATYSCVTTATNALGTGTSAPRTFTTGSFVQQTITFPQPANAHVADNTVTLAATASSALPVTYTSSTPTVCTVADNVVTLLSAGTCTIAADQAGDSGTDIAPTVTRSFSVLPAPPAPSPLSIATTGSASGTATIPVPAGDAVTLVGADGTTGTSVTVAGVGTYTLNPTTHVVTFTPVTGYSGTAPAVTYRLTDGVGQTADSTIVVAVAKPTAPVATPVSTTGGGKQTTTVTVPTGDSITLLDAAGNPTTKVVVKGEGTYTLDPSTGKITFAPATGASGKAKGVSYRVTDPYGQASTATYKPSILASGKPSVGVKPLTVAKTAGTGIPVTCKVSAGSAASCAVTLWAKVGGKSVVVGTGHRSVTGSHSSIVVTVKLTAKGQALVATPGGLKITAKASILPRGGKKGLLANGSTRVVVQTTPALRPVFFDIDQATLRPVDVTYLNGLRHQLAGVKNVTCSGYTDNNGNIAYNRDLGQRRADATCAFLLTGKSIKTTTASYGLDRPHATNDNSAGQALNRRVEIVLHY